VTPKTLKEWKPKLELGQLLSRNAEIALKEEILSYTASQAGRTLFILDGLDEVPSEYQKDLVDMLRGILQRNRQCRLMITSRPYANERALAGEDPKKDL